MCILSVTRDLYWGTLLNRVLCSDIANNDLSSPIGWYITLRNKNETRLRKVHVDSPLTLPLVIQSFSDYGSHFAALSELKNENKLEESHFTVFSALIKEKSIFPITNL